MSATTQLPVETLHSTHFGCSTSTSPNTYTTMQATLGVRLPSRCQAGNTLYPPLVAQIRDDHDDAGAQWFATAVLLDRQSIVLDGTLQGTTAVTGVSDASTSDTTFFAFTDLAIAPPGTYTIRVDIYKVSPLDANGATLVAQVSCDEITAQDEALPGSQPTLAEQQVLKEARGAGVLIP